MIRNDRILYSLKDNNTKLCVGFRPSNSGDYGIVSGINLLSKSGLYFDDVSEVVNAEMVYNLQRNMNIGTSEFNTLLTRLHDNVIISVCNELIYGNQSLIDSLTLFDSPKEINNKIDIANDFVGIELNISDAIDIAGLIPFIELLLDSSITFNLYLFNSNSNTYIKKQSCTTIANQPTVKELSDWYISYGNDFKGGSFIIGYFKNDLLTAKPYAKSTSTLNSINKLRFTDIKFVGFTGSSETIDISTKEYLSDSSGINLCINIFNDYTELLVRNQHLLYMLFQYKFIEKILNLVKFSIRTNKTKNLTFDMIDDINLELYGNKDLGIQGINGKYIEMLESSKKMIFN